MNESTSSSSAIRIVIAVVVIVVLSAATWWFLDARGTWPRGEALGNALSPMINSSDEDKSLVAKVIWGNYSETRANASRWSGVYWGFTFAAAILSALAGLILKFESIIKNNAVKKDIAAVFSIAAALLITISTSGDFQRKWQANRIAAAELELTGYEFLEKSAVDARSYLGPVGQIMHKRHMAIVGGTEQQKPATEDESIVSKEK